MDRGNQGTCVRSDGDYHPRRVPTPPYWRNERLRCHKVGSPNREGGNTNDPDSRRWHPYITHVSPGAGESGIPSPRSAVEISHRTNSLSDDNTHFNDGDAENGPRRGSSIVTSVPRRDSPDPVISHADKEVIHERPLQKEARPPGQLILPDAQPTRRPGFSESPSLSRESRASVEFRGHRLTTEAIPPASSSTRAPLVGPPRHDTHAISTTVIPMTPEVSLTYGRRPHQAERAPPGSPRSPSASSSSTSTTLPAIRNEAVGPLFRSEVRSQAHQGPAGSASPLVAIKNWPTYRFCKDFRKGGERGQTVWFKTRGEFAVDAPPASLRIHVRPTDLFVHVDTRTSASRVWMFDTDGRWADVRPGAHHPHFENRRLHVMPSGEPSWITKETAGVYGSRRKKKEREHKLIIALIQEMK